MIGWRDFEKKYKGKYVDVDGFPTSQKYQCYDLFARFELDNGIPLTHCGTSGYVKDIWVDRKSNGVLKYFDTVRKEDIQEGDWVIWPSSYSLTPYSHIGMCVGKNKCFGQNQGGVAYATVVDLNMQKAYGGLRYKGYEKKLDVNGKFDSRCVLILQRWLGAWQDGYIGGQLEKYKPNHPNLLAVSYTGGGSNTVRSLQKKLSASGYKMGIDGYWGAKTSGNLQRFLTAKGYKVGTDNIFGTKTAKRLQEFLNKEVL